MLRFPAYVCVAWLTWAMLVGIFSFVLGVAAAFAECLPSTMSTNKVLFLGFDPCVLRMSHGWVAYLPMATKNLHPSLKTYAQNNTNANRSIVEVTASGKCISTSVKQSDRFGLVLERNGKPAPYYKVRNIRSDHYAIIETIPSGPSCSRCDYSGQVKMLASWSILKPPSVQRMDTFLKLYHYNKNAERMRRTRTRPDVGPSEVELWSERKKWLDNSLGIIYYLHSFRYNKGHVAFIKGLLERQDLFANYTVHFSGSHLKNEEAYETWFETKRSLDQGNISYTRVVHDTKFAYEEHLCHPNGRVVVTWSDADANPRIPYDGLFCNLPHFSSYESNLNADLTQTGEFHHYSNASFPAKALHESLAFDWSEGPVRYALANVTYENMFCQVVKTYQMISKCCDI